MEEGTFVNEDTLEMHKRGDSEFSLENENLPLNYQRIQGDPAD